MREWTEAASRVGGPASFPSLQLSALEASFLALWVGTSPWVPHPLPGSAGKCSMTTWLQTFSFGIALISLFLLS